MSEKKEGHKLLSLEDALQNAGLSPDLNQVVGAVCRLSVNFCQKIYTNVGTITGLSFNGESVRLFLSINGKLPQVLDWKEGQGWISNEYPLYHFILELKVLSRP